MNSKDMCVGQRVFHRVFLDGVITGKRGSVVTVDFVRFGTKEMLVEFCASNMEALNTPRKIKKIKEGSRTYNKRLLEVLLGYCQITTCRECGSPTIHGYCCTYCGTGRP